MMSDDQHEIAYWIGEFNIDDAGTRFFGPKSPRWLMALKISLCEGIRFSVSLKLVALLCMSNPNHQGVPAIVRISDHLLATCGNRLSLMQCTRAMMITTSSVTWL